LAYLIILANLKQDVGKEALSQSMLRHWVRSHRWVARKALQDASVKSYSARLSAVKRRVFSYAYSRWEWELI
jgi:hypothetical protein